MMFDPIASRNHYDAVVVGARCAGAATAMLLARNGLSVLVVDRSRHGSDTLSTHALMRGAVVQLHRWGVLPAVVEAGTPKVSETSFHYGDATVRVAIKPADGIDGLYAPRRTLLDAILADAAAEAGAEVVRGAGLVDLVRDSSGRIKGAVIESRPGVSQEITAGIVIGADGVRSTVARLVDAPLTHERTQATGVVYGYFEGLEDSGYQWYFGPGVSAGVIATNGGACVFAGVPSERFWNEIRFDLTDGYFRILDAVDPELSRMVSTQPHIGRFRGYPGHNSYLRKCRGAGWALVGDAAYFKDPLTAHGITDALRDAELLARAVVDGKDEALHEYQQVRDELSLGLFEITDEIASFDWDTERLQGLHKAMSREMKQEVLHLQELDDAFVSGAGNGDRVAAGAG